MMRTSATDFDVTALVQGTAFPGPEALRVRPLIFQAVAPVLTGPVILKGRHGRHYRAVSRNGRVLIVSDRAASEWAGDPALFSLRLWRKKILPDRPPDVWGVLLRVRTRFSQARLGSHPSTAYPRITRVSVTHTSDPGAWLQIDLGARTFLLFRKEDGL